MTLITKQEFLQRPGLMNPIEEYARGMVYVQEMTAAGLDGKCIPLTEKENDLLSRLPEVRQISARQLAQSVGTGLDDTEMRRAFLLFREVMDESLRAQNLSEEWHQIAMEAYLETSRNMAMKLMREVSSQRLGIDGTKITGAFESFAASGLFSSSQEAEKAFTKAMAEEQ